MWMKSDQDHITRAYSATGKCLNFTLRGMEELLKCFKHEGHMSRLISLEICCGFYSRLKCGMNQEAWRLGSRRLLQEPRLNSSLQSNAGSVSSGATMSGLSLTCVTQQLKPLSNHFSSLAFGFCFCKIRMMITMMLISQGYCGFITIQCLEQFVAHSGTLIFITIR